MLGREDAATIRERCYADLKENGPATTWELALRMGYTHRQDVAPRLSELAKAQRIKQVGEKIERTGVKSGVWDITERRNTP